MATEAQDIHGDPLRLAMLVKRVSGFKIWKCFLESCKLIWRSQKPEAEPRGPEDFEQMYAYSV